MIWSVVGARICDGKIRAGSGVYQREESNPSLEQSEGPSLQLIAGCLIALRGAAKLALAVGPALWHPGRLQGSCASMKDSGGLQLSLARGSPGLGAPRQAREHGTGRGARSTQLSRGERVRLGNGESWRHQRCPAYGLEIGELCALLAVRWALLESNLCQKPEPSLLAPSGGFLSTSPVHTLAFSFQQSSFPLANPESPPFSDTCAFADVKAEVSAAPQARSSFPRKSDPIQDQSCKS